MPKLPTVNPQKIIQALKKTGFIFHRAKGSHLSFTHPVKKLYVVVPFHKKNLPKGTLLAIMKQAKITKEELIKLL